MFVYCSVCLLSVFIVLHIVSHCVYLHFIWYTVVLHSYVLRCGSGETTFCYSLLKNLQKNTKISLDLMFFLCRFIKTIILYYMLCTCRQGCQYCFFTLNCTSFETSLQVGEKSFAGNVFLGNSSK